MRSNNDNIVSTHYKQYNHTSKDYIVTAIDKETDYNNNSETKIAFLDTIIYRGKYNQILTRLYHKPTDNKQYLLYNSADPWKQKRKREVHHMDY